MGTELSTACRTKGDAAYLDLGADMACDLRSALQSIVCDPVLYIKQH